MQAKKKYTFWVSLFIIIFYMPSIAICQIPSALETGCTPEYRFDGKKLNLTEKQWRERLTPEEFDILRRGGTEPPFKNAYDANTQKGIYECAGCFLPLYSSKTKYDSHTGWPSFWAPICPHNVEVRNSFHLISSTKELVCSRCSSHLGDLFNDGPLPTGKRYCMNSAAMKFVPQ